MTALDVPSHKRTSTLFHEFEPCTFNTMTRCSSCAQFLWGFEKESWQCRFCYTACCHKCVQSMWAFTGQCGTMPSDLASATNRPQQLQDTKQQRINTGSTEGPTSVMPCVDTDASTALSSADADSWQQRSASEDECAGSCVVNGNMTSETCAFSGDEPSKGVHITTLAGSTLARFTMTEATVNTTIGIIKRFYCQGKAADQLLLDGEILENSRFLSEVMDSIQNKQAELLFVRHVDAKTEKKRSPYKLGGTLSKKLTRADSDSD